ncbi:MAG: methionine--tRNA ligase [Alphaproteobacteria bacterium]
MSTAKPSFYITSPIYYVNAAPHIGHAYTTVACDVMARWKRLDGYDVKFVTGTDEHGQKVQASAEARGVSPKDFTDEISAIFDKLAKDVGSSHDRFIRTTDDDHLEACQALWRKLLASGDIYLGAYEGWYSIRDEAFFQEDELHKNEDGVRIVTATGATVEWVEEPSYFFKLSAWAEPLIKHYEANPEAIQPRSRFNEVMSFLKGGLHDLSISRTTFDWGIPVPDQDGSDQKHIMYVWLDALTNYITALGYPNQDGEMSQFWPADVHVVGKDILRFHAVYWPAFLMSAGMAPPKMVFAHGWWTNEGQKISKSVGNVIDPYDLIATYGLDQTRYFMMREVKFGSDADFSPAAMIVRMNSDLANAWGNLVQRSLSMIGKNLDGKVPSNAGLTDQDKALLQQAFDLKAEMSTHMDKLGFKDALEAAWRVIGEANAYVDETAPWALKKTDHARMETVLYTLAETIRRIALLLQPFMPESQSKVLDQLAIDGGQREFAHLGDALESGVELPKPSGLFPRFVEQAD